MSVNTIFSEHKETLVDLLKNSSDLKDREVDTSIDTIENVLQHTFNKEAKNKGLSTLLNLFSNEDNSKSSNSFLNTIGNTLVKQLLASGISKEKAILVKQVLFPVIIEIFTSKISGNSDMLTNLLGSKSSSTNPIGGILSKFFKS